MIHPLRLLIALVQITVVQVWLQAVDPHFTGYSWPAWTGLMLAFVVVNAGLSAFIRWVYDGG